MQPCGNVPLNVQDAPDVDVIVTFDVENKVGKTLHRPTSDAGQIEFHSIAWRSRRGVTRNMPECLFDGIDEAQGDAFARFR